MVAGEVPTLDLIVYTAPLSLTSPLVDAQGPALLFLGSSQTKTRTGVNDGGGRGTIYGPHRLCRPIARSRFSSRCSLAADLDGLDHSRSVRGINRNLNSSLQPPMVVVFPSMLPSAYIQVLVGMLGRVFSASKVVAR